MSAGPSIFFEGPFALREVFPKLRSLASLDRFASLFLRDLSSEKRDERLPGKPELGKLLAETV